MNLANKKAFAFEGLTFPSIRIPWLFVRDHGSRDSTSSGYWYEGFYAFHDEASRYVTFKVGLTRTSSHVI